MKEKILALLLSKFAGVRKDGLAQLARTLALQATTDEEAKTLTDKLTKDQVDAFVKDYRADVDKEVSDGNKTFEANLKKKFDLVEKQGAPTPPAPGVPGEEPKPGDIAALIKAAVSEAVKPFQAELSGYKANEVTKSRLQQLTEKLSALKDENLRNQQLKSFGRMSFDTDEEFAEYLTETETFVNTANQNAVNSALGGHQRPWMSSSNNDKKEASKEELTEVFDKLPI